MLRKILPAAILMCLSLTVLANTVYVIDDTGRRITGKELTSDAEGNLTLVIDDVAKRSFKKGTYKTAFIPQPREVEQLQKAFEAGRFEIITRHTPSLLEKFGYVGWGDLMSYYLGMVEIDKASFEEARKIFVRGQNYRGSNQALLAKGMVLAFIGLKEYDKAQFLVDRLVAQTDGPLAAFAFNAQGKIYTEQGENRDAVLEYMKTLLLFRGDSTAVERAQAKKEVAALLKKMGDPRFKEFE